MVARRNPIGAIVVARLGDAGGSRQADRVDDSSSRPSPIRRSSRSRTCACSRNCRTRTQELTRSVEELRALGEVGQAVSSTLDLETVLATIVSRAVQLSGSYSGIVYEFDEATQAFYARATHRLTPEYLEALRAAPIRLGEGAMGRAGVIRGPVEVADVEGEAHLVAAQVRALSCPAKAYAHSSRFRSSRRTGCSAASLSCGASRARSPPTSWRPFRPSPPSRSSPFTTRASSGRCSVRSSTRRRSWRRARWRSRPWISTARS